MAYIEIPKANKDHSNFPCWVPVVRTVNWKERNEAMKAKKPLPEPILEKIKPLIICNCGRKTGIGLHHVHPDGTITASYFHTKDGEHGDPEGCEWHVFLKLKDWTGEEYLPVKK